ncbi:MAG: hypothetical protein MO852_12060 [Candidatus Devosia euplotis]|nr:hypothetical protein [Candidatus Devosia euplotis]
MLGTGRWSAVWRYFRRTLFEQTRFGVPEGGSDRLSWEMVQFIPLEQPRKRRRDIDLLQATGLPAQKLASMTEPKRLYNVW